MANRKSGGARATEAKHRKRDAARKRGEDGAEVSANRFAALLKTAPGPNADIRKRVEWLAHVNIEAVKDAMADVGLEPERRREQIVRLSEKAMKVLEPAKLAEELDELHEAYEELQATESARGQEQHNAGDDETSKAGGPPPGTALS